MDWGYRGGLLLKNKEYWEAEVDPFFVLEGKGYFVIKHTKLFPAPLPSNK